MVEHPAVNWEDGSSILSEGPRPRGEIGIRSGFKLQSLLGCRFESCRGYIFFFHLYSIKKQKYYVFLSNLISNFNKS